MQEFKVGDKALAEVKIAGEDKRTGEYQVKPERNTWTFWAAKDKVHQLSAKETDIPDKTYEEGLAEAWETARLIGMTKESGGMSTEDLISAFGTGATNYIFRDNTAQEAIEKIKDWVAENEIHVGDIVEMMGGLKGLVTKIKDGRYNVIYADGGCRKTTEGEKVRKTGRTIDIAGLLAEIGGMK